jgi:hypothetical protein
MTKHLGSATEHVALSKPLLSLLLLVVFMHPFCRMPVSCRRVEAASVVYLEVAFVPGLSASWVADSTCRLQLQLPHRMAHAGAAATAAGLLAKARPQLLQKLRKQQQEWLQDVLAGKAS